MRALAVGGTCGRRKTCILVTLHSTDGSPGVGHPWRIQNRTLVPLGLNLRLATQERQPLRMHHPQRSSGVVRPLASAQTPRTLALVRCSRIRCWVRPIASAKAAHSAKLSGTKLLKKAIRKVCFLIAIKHTSRVQVQHTGHQVTYQ